MSSTTWDVIRLSFQVSIAATALVLVPAMGVGYFLARKSFKGDFLVSGLISLPLVLPPTAVGFLLLEILAEDGLLGRRTLGFDLGLLLTWKGAVLASGVMAFPLVARTARATFESIDPRLESLALTLGLSKWRAFVRVSLPLARRGLIAGVILGFTRALGEFGATVLVAGNIEGETQTLASAIFTAQQIGKDERAFQLMGIALALGYAAIVVAEWLSRSTSKNARRRGAER